MKRFLILTAAVAMLCQSAPAKAETWFGFQVGMTGRNPPPPPQVVFRSEPRYVVVEDVRVIEDERLGDDMFVSDNFYWRLHDGYWYRARTWRGPWVGIDVRRVPERVLVVPARHWKHHPRHGRDGRTVIVVRDGDRHEEGRGRGRGRGRGHGHGHGHDRDDDD